jgi:hypothetical protein
VEDIFFITDKEGLPLQDEIIANALQEKICQELDNQAAAIK